MHTRSHSTGHKPWFFHAVGDTGGCGNGVYRDQEGVRLRIGLQQIER